MIGKIFAQGELGSANGAEHVATVGKLFDAHLLAKADVTELAAGRAFDLADLEFATDRGLTKGQGGVTFEVGGESWHLSGIKKAY